MEENTINLEELMKQADDETESIRKKAEENSVTIGRVIVGFGCSMESYIITTHALYGRLPNDDEKKAILGMTNGVLRFIGVEKAFGLDRHDFIMASISMWRHALTECGFDPEEKEGAI